MTSDCSAPQVPSLARPRASLAVMSAALGVAVLALASFAFLPVEYVSADASYDIPKGTWARRRAGEDLGILPARIRLFSGTSLVLKNLDEVPQIFGPTLIMPGQTLRLPFDMPAEYQFACTAHVSGQMTIVVDEAPTQLVARLRWRARALVHAISRFAQAKER
jgi:hypothetical protein